MIGVIAIIIGGALGSLCRYVMSMNVYLLLGKSFPYGTLAVNILGSIIIGSVYILAMEKITISEELRAGITVGFLGAFTTFSAFSIETIELFRQGKIYLSILYVILSFSFSIIAAYTGLMLLKM